MIRSKVVFNCRRFHQIASVTMTTNVNSSCDTAKLRDPPMLLRGPVIKGFQRGSKELGIPTANLDAEALKDALNVSETGIYFGWAGLRGRAFKMVVSIGWNPFFKNERKTVEPHLLHDFEAEGDFYDEDLQLVICGFLRPEQPYDSLDALIAAIRNDIFVADKLLSAAPYDGFKSRLLGCSM